MFVPDCCLMWGIFVLISVWCGVFENVYPKLLFDGVRWVFVCLFVCLFYPHCAVLCVYFVQFNSTCSSINCSFHKLFIHKLFIP